VIGTRYRYPRISDRKLDLGVTGTSLALAVVSVVFVPSPWLYALLVLVLALFVGTAVQLRRRYRRDLG